MLEAAGSFGAPDGDQHRSKQCDVACICLVLESFGFIVIHACLKLGNIAILGPDTNIKAKGRHGSAGHWLVQYPMKGGLSICVNSGAGTVMECSVYMVYPPKSCVGRAWATEEMNQTREEAYQNAKSALEDAAFCQIALRASSTRPPEKLEHLALSGLGVSHVQVDLGMAFLVEQFEEHLPSAGSSETRRTKEALRGLVSFRAGGLPGVS